MIINRTNITEILGGVPFSKNFSITEMQQSLTAALPNVKDKYPQLYQDLSLDLIEVDKLVVQQKIIQDQAVEVAKLQEQIEQANEALKKATTIYEQSNQQIVAVIGSAPTGGPPLYPTAAVESLPLIQAVTTASESLDQASKQFKEKSQSLAESSIKQKEDTEAIGQKIIIDIEKTAPVEYNTDVEQYIYT